ncbi:hypothetical protein Tco_0433019 [Tanacetum coccineum]
MMKMLKRWILPTGGEIIYAEVQEKSNTKTGTIIQEVTPTEVIQDQGSSEKGNSKVSTRWEQIKAKRKKSLPRKSTRSTVKRQKMELDDEKEDLKGYLDIVPREDVAEDVESLSTKYPIVDWKTYTLSKTSCTTNHQRRWKLKNYEDSNSYSADAKWNCQFIMLNIEEVSSEVKGNAFKDAK